MIDNQLINDTQHQISFSLQNVNSVGNGLYTINDILPQATLIKLKEYVESVDAPWEALEAEEYKNAESRKKIAWHFDTVVEELHVAFENVTDDLNKLLPKEKRHNFIGISLWKDSEGYEMEWHTDNPMLSVALQIYLFDCPDEYGTVFQLNSKEVMVPFKNNTGYLADHTVDPKLVHRPAKKLSNGITRYSLYATWSLSEKIILPT